MLELKFVSMQNFEAAVQDNVLVNGESWEEAPDDGGDLWSSPGLTRSKDLSCF